jgi:hypothetical protein
MTYYTAWSYFLNINDNWTLRDLDAKTNLKAANLSMHDHGHALIKKVFFSRVPVMLRSLLNKHAVTLQSFR